MVMPCVLRHSLRCNLSMGPGMEGTYLVGLGLQLLLSHAVGPVVPKNTANRVWQHHLDVGVHVLQEAASAADGPPSAASSYKVSHTRLGLHPNLHQQVKRITVEDLFQQATAPMDTHSMNGDCVITYGQKTTVNMQAKLIRESTCMQASYSKQAERAYKVHTVLHA